MTAEERTQKQDQIRWWLGQLEPGEQARILAYFCENFGLVLEQDENRNLPVTGGITLDPASGEPVKCKTATGLR